jgi:hypothetical protein
MRNYTRATFVVVAALTGMSLSACTLDPNKGVPYPYVTIGNNPLTAEKVVYQDKVVQPRCEQVAKETTPNRDKLGAYYAFNHAQSGAVGGLGYATELKVASLAANPPLAGGIAVAGAMNGAANGFVSGRESADNQLHGNTKNCISSDAEGVHMIPPSEGRKIATGKQPPTSYGAPVEWSDHRPTASEN